jgi:hypothetical protein
VQFFAEAATRLLGHADASLYRTKVLRLEAIGPCFDGEWPEVETATAGQPPRRAAHCAA